jgi:hypothetical protein
MTAPKLSPKKSSGAHQFFLADEPETNQSCNNNGTFHKSPTSREVALRHNQPPGSNGVGMMRLTCVCLEGKRPHEPTRLRPQWTTAGTGVRSPVGGAHGAPAARNSKECDITDHGLAGGNINGSDEL